MYKRQASDSVRADLILKREDLDLEYTVAGLSDVPGRAKALSSGASLEFGFKVHETPAMTVEPVGNLSHVPTRIGSFSVGPTAFDFGSGDTSRGAVGLNLRGTSMLAGTGFFPSATLKYWNVFKGGYTSAINTVAFNYDGTGSYVEASAMLEYIAPDTGWGGFVAGSGFFGGASSGVRAQVGLNLEW